MNDASQAYLKDLVYEGALHDTVRIRYTPVGNNSRQLGVVVSWEKNGGGVFERQVSFEASCPAADPGAISVYTATGERRIGYNSNSTTQTKEIYCEGLTYELRVSEGMDRIYTESAPLQYAWFVADTIDDKIDGFQFQNYTSGEAKNKAYSRVTIDDTGSYWMVRARTCDAGGTVAKPSFKKIENILRKTIVSDTLRVKHIRYIEPKEGEQKVWVSIDETPDKDMKNVACVYYSDSVNNMKFKKIYEGNEKGQTGSRPSAEESVSGYIDLEASPFDFSEDIFFPHYRFKWIYDTADLEIATDKMRPNTSRSEDKGFGPDKARICFRIKERAKVTEAEKEEGVNRKKIPVSFEVYCPECEAEAVKNGRTGDDTVYRKKSETLTLIRIDSLPEELPYTPTFRMGDNPPELIEDNVPEICGNTVYQLCGKADDEDADYGRLCFVWNILRSPGTWQREDSKEGCVGVKTPEIAQTETHFGDTCKLYVYPRNQCFRNGWRDTKRDTVTVYVKALPPAPSIVDPLDESYTRPFVGTKEPEKPDAFDNKASILLCNYNAVNENWPIRSYYLISKNSPIKPQKDDGKEGGYTLTLPEGFEGTISYQITSLDGTTNPNDTNIITLSVNGESAREKLKDESQLALGFAAANECGPGSAMYYPVNIIDTLPVYEHIRHNPYEADTTLDSIGWACEGELWRWTLQGETGNDKRYEVRPLVSAEGGYSGAARNTDKIEYVWTFTDPTWYFQQATLEGANPTTVGFGRNSGQVWLALRNRCGTSKPRPGDYVNVNPFTRVKIKVTDMTDAATARPAYDPLLAPGASGAASNQEFLVQPCRGTNLVYAADTSYLTEEYLWVFPSDWKVLDDLGYGTAFWIGGSDSANFARTKNDSLFDPMRGIDEMRVAVHVGADTGDIMVIGKKTGCSFAYDNVAGGAAHPELRDGHRADSLRVFVRPFTGKPSLLAWSNDLCVRTAQTLAVRPDPTQDKKTQQETYFTWTFPEDWIVDYRNTRRDTVDVVIPDRITKDTTINGAVFRSDTVKIYSHRYDCDPTNKGDSTIHAFRLVDTLSLDPGSVFKDLLHKGMALNLSPCEGDTVEYTLDGSFHREMDSIVFRWSLAKDLNGTRDFVTGDSLDLTGWRVLNEGSYSANPRNPTTG
ncbi:MAG: hypothetical protein K2I66_06825, partial [Bacteroidales bacterium]|nr:hypothetical protein [Bacteroidales bacterium]